MSYLALARKWRPSKFEHVVGQNHVITALSNALKQNRLHHAYLFSGTRGVGKTSIARLFAKGLNCETGITDEPCGQCSACQEIEQGRHVDLLEIDAASRTKVEDTRELLDNVQYKPARGRFKIYLIDEVHMLSRHSFNALLKTLEEPPEHVKFLLATTDPDKLPVTILSRCLQFHLKPIAADEIQTQLESILEQESISSELKSLSLIAYAADGSMRDALSLTDQAIALGNGHLDSANVSQMLGSLDSEKALDLIEALQLKNTQIILDTIQVLADFGVDWDGLLKQVISQFHKIAMYQALPSTLDKTQLDASRIERLSQSISPEQIQLYYQMCLKSRADLPYVPHGKMAIEMLMLRMIAFRLQTQTNLPQKISLDLNSNPKVKSQVSPHVSPQPIKDNLAVHAQNAPSSTPASTQQNNQQNTTSSQINLSSTSAAAYLQKENATSTLSASQSALTNAKLTKENQTPPPAQGLSASQLKHQLRSKRDKLKGKQAQAIEDPSNQGDPLVKKTKAATASQNILERIAAKHANTQTQYQDSPPISSNGTPMSGIASSYDEKPKPQTSALNHETEAYRWQPVNPQKKQAKPVTLTPTHLKQAIAHEKTPQMQQELILQAQEQDLWSRIIASLTIEKMVEQLALNASFSQQGEIINLILREKHQHLNTQKAHDALALALSDYFKKPCQLDIQIGESGETPLELRDKLYQHRLETAFDALASDPNVSFFIEKFDATLDEESIRPVSTLNVTTS